jgi:hypothetical protein
MTYNHNMNDVGQMKTTPPQQPPQTHTSEGWQWDQRKEPKHNFHCSTTAWVVQGMQMTPPVHLHGPYKATRWEVDGEAPGNGRFTFSYVQVRLTYSFT